MPISVPGHADHRFRDDPDQFDRDRRNGDRDARVWPASLFVMVLGASSYTYGEAARDQQLTAWLSAHIHAFE